MNLEKYKQKLNSARAKIREDFFQHLEPSISSKKITRLYDTIIQELFDSVLSNRKVTVFGLGSYGRECPAPYSDIDILLLVENAEQIDFEEDLESFIQSLWDLGYEVGHNFIDLENWQECAKKDHIFLTNLMDARFICGSRHLSSQFLKKYDKFLADYPLDRYIKEKLDSIKQARRKYGNSFLLKEPNIKESPGGLRDYQLILWTARKVYNIKHLQQLVEFGILEKPDMDALEKSYDFLMKIRFILHYLSGKNLNLLNLSIQRSIASRLGYEDNTNLSAVEQFMRDYYQAAKKIHYFSKLIIRLLVTPKSSSMKKIDDNFFVINKHIYTTTEDVFSKDPLNLLRVFYYLQKGDYYLAHSTEKLIEKSLQWAEGIRESEAAAHLFDEIISKTDHLAKTLKYMHFTGVLGAYIPEFSKIDCLYQEEEHHQYTVDEHILRAIERLEKLHFSRKHMDRFYKNILKKIPDIRILILAVLFHDIGKYLGKGHAEKGARLVPRILNRLYYPSYIVNFVTELVRKHLLMTHTFQMHDIENEEIIKRFAAEVGEIDFLNYLTLLTYLDVTSVSENLWTAWKSTLLQILYNNTYNYLIEGALPLEEMEEYARRIEKYVLKEYEETKYSDIARDFLKKVPKKYLLSYSIYQILYHIKVAYRARNKEIFITHRYIRKTKSYMVTICTRDQIRLFSRITGVLSYFGLNIVSADIFTRSDGMAIDTIYFTSNFALTRYDWEKVKKMMYEVIRGETDLEDKLRQKMKAIEQHSRPHITFDNELLSDYTVAYIKAQDRIGLLYNVTGAFSDMGLTIKYSKIMTEGGTAIDTFYFTDMAGRKVLDEIVLSRLEKRIWERLMC